ncbi:MAG: hypothetical protein OXS29_16405 [bacterium]|nr:hypothetical protein [bacterium]MDE0288800.1 hypothetical protein [bacterium]MDE0438455.1 hypothetical protein [bacterium]
MSTPLAMGRGGTKGSPIATILQFENLRAGGPATFRSSASEYSIAAAIAAAS